MIRAVVASIMLVTFVEAHRVNVDGGRIGNDAGSQFFDSCEDLEVIFRSHVASLQALLDANRNATGVNALTRARFPMRAFGVVRTLRRAKDCPWVVHGDSEDIERTRAIAQTTLAANPCEEAARAELTPEAYATAANELEPLQRSMLVLLSDTCDVPEVPEVEGEAMDPADEGTVMDRLIEDEARARDGIDELFEEAALESESLTGGSFVQTEAHARGFRSALRLVGALLYGVFYLLSCVGVGYVIGMLLGFFLSIIVCNVAPGACRGSLMVTAPIGAVLGLATCGREMLQSGNVTLPQGAQ